MIEVSEELKERVKYKLNITWKDTETEGKISNLIEDAISTLNFKIGNSDIDYNSPGIERSLFLNYCLYSWNDCLNEFDKDYINEIYQVRSKYEVNRYEKEA